MDATASAADLTQASLGGDHPERRSPRRCRLDPSLGVGQQRVLVLLNTILTAGSYALCDETKFRAVEAASKGMR